MEPTVQPGKGLRTASLILGIVSIVTGTLGVIFWGISCGITSIACGIVAIVLGVNAAKQANGAKGGGFTCGLIGLIFGVVFTLGCTIVSCACSCKYGYSGVIGGSCSAANDVNKVANEIENSFNW